jgi:hypothetical protein
MLQLEDVLKILITGIYYSLRRGKKHIYMSWVVSLVHRSMYHHDETDCIHQRLQYDMIAFHQFTQTGRFEYNVCILVDCERGGSR